MFQLIDKEALVAEIERLDEFWHLSKGAGGQAFIESLLSFINSFEIKEVDLDEEIQKNIYNHFYDFYGILKSDTGIWAEVRDMVRIAKYFYDLGLKTKKGE